MEENSKSIKHWGVLACTSGLAACSIGINLNTIGVFYTPVSENLGFYRGNFAMHTTILSIAMSLVALHIPRLLGHFDFKKMLWFGVGLSAIATILMAATSSLIIFYVLAALRGIGSAFYSMVPLTILVNNWFEKKNGLAMSLGFGSSGIAGALLTPVFEWLIQQFGWRSGFIAMGILIVVFCLPACLISFTLHPREEGLVPYGYEEEPEFSKGNTNDFTARKKVSYLNFSFLSLCIVALLHASITGLPHHFPGYAETIGFSSNLGAWMLSAAMLGNISFKLLSGVLEDRIGTTPSAFIILGLNFIATVCLIFFRLSNGLLFSAFVFGSIHCVPIIVLPMLTIRYFGKLRYMKVYPILSFMAGVGGAFAVSLIGYIFDFTGSYLSAFYIALFFHIVCFTLLVIGLKRSS